MLYTTQAQFLPFFYGMNVDIRITGELSFEKATALQTALTALALASGPDNKPPAFLGIDGLYASRVQTRIGDVALYVGMELVENK